MQSYRFLRLVIGTHPEHIPAVLTLQPAQALASGGFEEIDRLSELLASP
jgi:hypothetical protein